MNKAIDIVSIGVELGVVAGSPLPPPKPGSESHPCEKEVKDTSNKYNRNNFLVSMMFYFSNNVLVAMALLFVLCN